MRLMNCSMILPLLLVTSCGIIPREIEVIETEIKTPIIFQESPKAVETYPINFKVINENNLEQFLEEIRSLEGEVVFIAINVRDYEKLALNTQDLVRYIKQQKEIIIYYETLLEGD
jgi:hypothetical protein